LAPARRWHPPFDGRRLSGNTSPVDSHRLSASTVIARTPEDLYDMVADVTRMGEWSPVCKACWWDEGAGPNVASMFTGRNELPDRTWETRCEVVAADRGHEFAFVVQATGTRWGYTFTAVDGGTEVSESWEFPPKSEAVFKERFGDDAPAQLANREETARQGMPATLAALKATAEGRG
jgi:hypothetical protein